MRVFITGINGRIGNILRDKLLNLYDIYGVDISGKENKNTFVSDISEMENLIKIFEKIGKVDCVIHLAADHRIDADWKNVLRNNIISTKNLYECVRIFSVPKVVFASSNHVTGGYEGIPPTLHLQDSPKIIRVSDLLRPDGDYGSSKVYGEAVARQYLELYGIKSVCLRIGTVIENDNPIGNPRHMKTWLSHRDLTQLIEKSIRSDIDFGVYYGVSNNTGRFWDITNAEIELGYKPEDNSRQRLAK